MTTIHASCVSFASKAVLIRGASGSGKSDLVLRLIDGEGYGLGDTLLRAQLVADDQVQLVRQGDLIMASPPQALAGLLEIRGQGVVSLSHQNQAILALVVDLMPASEIERMPDQSALETEILGLKVPWLALDATTASAPACLRAWLSKSFSSQPKKR